MLIYSVGAWTNNAYFDLSNDHLGMNESLGGVITSLDYNNLSVLKNGTITTAQGSTNHYQYLKFNSSWPSPRLVYEADDNDVVADFIKIRDTDFIFQYDVEFDSGLRSEVSNAELTDLRGKYINILGSDYYFADTSLPVGNVDLTLYLLECMENATLTNGSNNNLTLCDGVDYQVDILAIDTNTPFTTNISFNGESTNLSEGESDVIGAGSLLYVGVWNITNTSVTYYLGLNMTEIRDSDVTDGAYDAGFLSVGSETIDGASIKIGGYNTSSTIFRLNNISYRLDSDDDYHIGVGNGFRGEFSEPEAMITTHWDLMYHGLNYPDFTDSTYYIPINVYHTSDNASYYINFTNVNGDNVSFPYVDNSNTSNQGFKYGTHNNSLHFFEGYINITSCNMSCVFNIEQGDYFIISNQSDLFNPYTISTVLRYESINTTNSNITFTDLADGSTIIVSYVASSVENVTGTGGLVVNGMSHNVTIENSSTYAIAVDMNYDLDINTSDEVRITVNGGGILGLGNQSNITSSNNITLSLTTLSTHFEEYTNNETSNVTITRNDATNTVDFDISNFGLPSGLLAMYEPGTGSNSERGMTMYGALFNHTGVNLTSTLVIYYPLNQVFGNASIQESVGISMTLSASSATVSVGTFNFTVNVTSNYFNTCDYAIFNSSDSSVVWNSSSCTQDFTQNFDALYLPVGNWTIRVNATDTFGYSTQANTTLDSLVAIVPNISGSSSATGTIGGGDVVFTFDIITKGYPYIKFFMNLTSGANTYDVSYASIGINNSVRKDVSGYPSYAGAEALTLPAISSAPGYAGVTSGIYQYSATTLRLTPYSGMSAGTYTGSYGWGLFDSSS